MLAGCRQATAPRDPIDRDAEAYIRIGLALAERDPDSLDSYVGPAAWQTDAQAHKQPLADVQRAARDLAARLDAAAEPHAAESSARERFLARQLHAIVARIDVLLGVRRPFAEESRLLFGVAPQAVDR